MAASARPIEVHGHRGARARFPENTLPALEYALKVGADVLEFDLAVTKDDVVVINHDPAINPEICTDEKGGEVEKNQLIRNMTLAEVKKFDCGRKKNLKFSKQTPVPGTKMPTLEEFFDLIKNSKDPHANTVRFNIELKSDPRRPEQAPAPREFAMMVLSLLKKHNMIQRTVLQSFDHRTLVEAKKLESSITISALTEKEFTGIDYAKIISEIKPDILSPNAGEITGADVKAVQKLNVKVIPWTVNRPEEWSKLIAAGVDGIISDDPEDLIAYLKEKKLRK